MGRWLDRLKLLNAQVSLPTEPAEGASGGSAGEVEELSQEELRILAGLPAEQARALCQVKMVFDGIIEKREHGTEINAADLIREGKMR